MRQPFVLWKLLVLTLVAVASLCFTATPVSACMGCICVEGPNGEIYCECTPPTLTTPKDGEELGPFDSVVLRFPDRDQDQPTKAEIGIYGYSTTHIENGFACVVAMPKVPGVVSVDSIVNYNSLTGKPLPGVTFTSNPSSARPVGEIGTRAGLGDDWFTFVSHITEKVEDGIPNHFVVEVTLDGDTTTDELIRSLRQQGAFFTGSSNQQGVPDGGHLFLKRLGAFDVIVLYPPVPKAPFEPGTRLTPLQP